MTSNNFVIFIKSCSKDLWSIISGTTCCCAKETVEDEIKNGTTFLKEGLLYFKPYTDTSLQSISKRDPPPLQQMYDLISKLAPFLVSRLFHTCEIIM